MGKLGGRALRFLCVLCASVVSLSRVDGIVIEQPTRRIDDDESTIEVHLVHDLRHVGYEKLSTTSAYDQPRLALTRVQGRHLAEHIAVWRPTFETRLTRSRGAEEKSTPLTTDLSGRDRSTSVLRGLSAQSAVQQPHRALPRRRAEVRIPLRHREIRVPHELLDGLR